MSEPKQPPVEKPEDDDKDKTPQEPKPTDPQKGQWGSV